MPYLTLVRHGESTWNKENRFTGWIDVDLTPEGILAARKAGQQLLDAKLTFHQAYTSKLTRAVRTLWEILDRMSLSHLSVQEDWRLNERHYGALQGKNKAEMKAQFGEEQVQKWRRSYSIAPEALSRSDPTHPCADPRYADVPQHLLPDTECLQDTLIRLLPYWHEEIAPSLQKNQNVLIVAHGNSLRALLKHLENIDDNDIMQVCIPNTVPIVYRLDQNLKIQEKKIFST